MLANGLYWGSRLLQRKRLSAVVQTWPGLHDLVPIDDRLTDASGAARAAWEIDRLPRFNDIVAARSCHVETRQWWADGGHPRPAQLTVSGWGHGTPSTLAWDGRHLKTATACLPGERDGDGTVPAFSAVPPELSGGVATAMVQPSGDAHGAIGHTDRLREYLLLLNSGDPPPTRGATDPSFLGFDVAPLAEPGDRVTGALRFDGRAIPAQAADGSPAVSATLRSPPSSGAGADIEWAIDVETDEAGAFVVDLPEGVEGVLELSARVDGLPGGRRRSEDRVVVVGAEG